MFEIKLSDLVQQNITIICAEGMGIIIPKKSAKETQLYCVMEVRQYGVMYLVGTSEVDYLYLTQMFPKLPISWLHGSEPVTCSVSETQTGLEICTIFSNGVSVTQYS